MLKKNIINSVIAFSVVAIFIYLSMLGLNGVEKTLPVTVMLIIAVVFLTNFKEEPYKKILGLAFLLSFSIILAYFAGTNLYLSIVVNLIWIPILLYLGITNFKTPIYFLILFTYLINLVFKVSAATFVSDYKYLIAVFIGAIIIKFAIKLLRNGKDFGLSKNRFKFKTTNSLSIFSIELGIVTAIIYFIITYFKLNFGDWILFGIIALLNPYDKETISFDKQTLMGSTFGILRILIVVTFVPLYPVRMGIMAIGAYILMFSNKYRTRTMGGMMFALSMTEIGSYFHGIDLSQIIYRIIYIVIAFAIAFVYGKTLRKIVYRQPLLNKKAKYISIKRI